MFPELLSMPWIRGGVIVLASLLVAWMIELFFIRVVAAIVARTSSKIDDRVAAVLRRPVFYSVLLVALAWALREVGLSGPLDFLSIGLLKTCAVILWAVTLVRIGSIVFQAFAREASTHDLIQARTRPLFDIFIKLTVFALATYLIMLAWQVNVGAWFASAGIAGIALGFAAKDSLSNLFAGIFIVADATYSVGDFIELDGEMRGAVTSIGFRSTRLLTLDDVEIVVPNSVIGQARIVNESGGPYKMARVAIQVECAYGSDADHVRDVLLQCVDGAERVATYPAPMVRFESFGASGLVHQLLVWIEHPRYRELGIDDVNRRIYRAFAAENIEIPYSKHDLYIKEMTATPVGSIS
ncbi:MAG: mechanosensitive ion channel family protein, partial [Polyangiaceae bacterium]|nr:mechanosensitive ion channel family protein [Polyangiaceae bacterium]